MSAHRWHITTSLTGEYSRRICVVCDVIRIKRPLGGITVTQYSHDGKAWSSASPECTATAHVEASTEAGDAR